MDDPDSPRAMPATPVACRPVAPTSASGTSENGSFKSCGSKAGPRRHPIRSSSVVDKLEALELLIAKRKLTTIAVSERM